MFSPPPDLRPRSRRLALGLGTLLVLGACASTGPALPERPGVFNAPAPGAGNPNVAPQPGVPPGSPAPTPLAMEQRFLEDWFRGTPVVIAATPPTTLQVDVPLVHSFDTGKSDIKPALAKVLERVSQSLLRHAGARITVTASGDASNASAELAQARAQRVRESLGLRGVSATRVTVVEAARGGSAVQLRLAMPAVSSQPVARRAGDSQRRSASGAGSNGGVQTISTQRLAPATAPMWTEKAQQ
jgi:outer membrane protein OmpA-like peptidoglycan-associated protein